MTAHPLVTVIVPTFNRWDLLPDALRSLQAQTYPAWEAVVVNDGGEPPRGEAVRLFDDPRIRYVEHPRNRGLAQARNTALSLAAGEWIAYLDDDDVFHPDHLEAAVGALLSHDWDVAYTDVCRATCEVSGGACRVLRTEDLALPEFDPEAFWRGNFIPVLCVVHRRSCLDRTGLFDPRLRILEDWDLWLRMSECYWFHHIPRVTCQVRVRGDGSNMMERENRRLDAEVKAQIYRKYLEDPAMGQGHRAEGRLRGGIAWLVRCHREWFAGQLAGSEGATRFRPLYDVLPRKEKLRLFARHPIVLSRFLAEKTPISRPSGSDPKRVLIACDHFWPSVGGVEIVAENLGYELTRRGFRVDIAAGSHPDRKTFLHRGMTVLSLDRRAGWFSRLPRAVRGLRRLLEKGGYDASILLADPMNWVLWSIEGADLRKEMRLAVEPLINEEGYETWRGNREFRRRLAGVLRRADTVVSLTRNGTVDRFLNEEGIPSVYLPNAVRPCRSSGNFRTRHGIPEDVPVLLHVANLWPVKNHLGLLETLRDLEGDWLLVLVGHPSGDASYTGRLRARIENDRRVRWIPGTSQEEVAEAMEAAQVVLLASHAEVSPLTLLEAMSHGRPWIATPSCGAATDWAGGVVVSLPGFPGVLRRLLGDRRLRDTLGEAGYTHWKTCFTWEAVASGWETYINTGTVCTSFAMPEEVSEKMASVPFAGVGRRLGETGTGNED